MTPFVKGALIAATVFAIPGAFFVAAILGNHDSSYHQLAEVGGVMVVWIVLSAVSGLLTDL